MLTMIRADEALLLVLQACPPREAREMDAADSLGLVLARAVVADRDYPPFDRSVMDGFAVRMGHAGKTVRVRGEVKPGVAASMGPDEDGCVAIMTGSPVPKEAEAVVMKEETRREGDGVAMPAVIRVGQNIVRAGSEQRAGVSVLPVGAVVTPIALGLLATVGQTRVWARSRPEIALLVTGDEVVGGGNRPAGVQIRDSNGPVLRAMARAAGFPIAARDPVHDTTAALAAALGACSADVVVLTGGVSAGNYDLVPAALEAHGVTLVFHKVRQQPGKPILFGTKGARLFFGLPGTPLGCHLGFHRYVLPAARAMAGLPAVAAEQGRLTHAWSTGSDRQQFVLARVAPAGGAWEVALLGPSGSSDLFTAWNANAMVTVPEGTRALAIGAEVSFEWLAS